MDKDDVFVTNMDNDDPLIDKFMEEYLKEDDNDKNVARSEDLVVNFDITYPDGNSENHSCGSESEVFGNYEGCLNDKVDPEEMKCYYNDTVSSEDNNCRVDDDCDSKWDNCHDEVDQYYCDCDDKSKDECEDKKEKHEHNKKKKGQIIVYSVLGRKDGINLKGVKINLYKINGVCPELVECKVTDCCGKAVFNDVDYGCYRVIELIDKNYFKKPVYDEWNEVNVCKDNTDFTIYVINNIKRNRIC